MMKFFSIVSAAIVFASTPTLAAQNYAVTPSGASEVLFAEPATEAIGKLSAKCIDARWSVISSTATELVCEAPMNFGQSILGTLLMGNSYSTPPRRFFKYTVSTVSGVSRVQATGWMELQMAFGQMRRTDFSGPEFHNSAINFMRAAGGMLPQGTTFPNHVFLGIGLEPAPIGNKAGLRVAEVEGGSPAAQAGIQVGDVITSIAKKRLKTGDDLLDATAKAAKTSAFSVELIRASGPIELTVSRAFRPAFNEVVVSRAPTPTLVTLANPQPTSVADELAKLGKLKTDGLITQAEFDQQKTKLLAQ